MCVCEYVCQSVIVCVCVGVCKSVFSVCVSVYVTVCKLEGVGVFECESECVLVCE